MNTSKPTDAADADESRFQFGKNWHAFLGSLDEDRVEQAIRSLRELLGDSLEDKRFLDLGSGSGLFSLAAHRLGADVVSVDYDDDSVDCTNHLRRTFANDSDRWVVKQGSALDEDQMASFGEFDVVYSWGVLHHTGDLWRAIEVAARCVRTDGRFVLSIYNDQGSASRRWLRIKQIYNASPRPLRPAWAAAVASVYEAKFALARLRHGRNPLPFADWKAKRLDRGMSAWHDWVDWVGGLPFEVAGPDAIVEYLTRRGFETQQIKRIGKGWGCNEFVFRRLRL